jgi:hypothetical protein
MPTSNRVLSKAWAKRGLPEAILWEVLTVESGSTVVFSIEAAAKSGQGVLFAADCGFSCEGMTYPKLVLWQDTAPSEVAFEVFNADGLLHFYNVWRSDRGAGGMNSQSFSSAMIREELADGARYRCNDIGFNEQFNSLVFSLRILPNHAFKRDALKRAP